MNNRSSAAFEAAWSDSDEKYEELIDQGLELLLAAIDAALEEGLDPVSDANVVEAAAELEDADAAYDEAFAHASELLGELNQAANDLCDCDEEHKNDVLPIRRLFLLFRKCRTISLVQPSPIISGAFDQRRLAFRLCDGLFRL